MPNQHHIAMFRFIYGYQRKYHIGNLDKKCLIYKEMLNYNYYEAFWKWIQKKIHAGADQPLMAKMYSIVLIG